MMMIDEHSNIDVFGFFSSSHSFPSPTTTNSKKKHQGFRDDKSREAALAECSAGVIERCVAGAAGGCAVNAARACERSVPRPKSGKNPFSFVTGAFRSKEDKLKEQEELRRAYREARERCEADQRESCALEARKVCEAHSGAFCAAVVRGRGRLEDMLDESDDEERAEKVPVEEQKKGGGGESSSIKR